MNEQEQKKADREMNQPHITRAWRKEILIMNNSGIALEIAEGLVDGGFAQECFALTVQDIIKGVLDERCPKTEMTEQRKADIIELIRIAKAAHTLDYTADKLIIMIERDYIECVNPRAKSHLRFVDALVAIGGRLKNMGEKS